MDSGANAGCSSGDCEGEEQEDPSSSSYDHGVSDNGGDSNEQDKDNQIKTGEDNLSTFLLQWQRDLESSETPRDDAETIIEAEPAQDNEMVAAERGGGPEAGEDELAAFRQQWQRELEATPTRQRTPAPCEDAEPADDEEKAKKYFLKGAELERGGKWYEAIQQYKRAMAIVPDIERRLYETTKGIETPQEEVEIEEEEPVNNNIEDDDDEEVIEGEEVVSRLLRIQARRGIVITPAMATRGSHISSLPYEVLQGVLRWVVSSELDCVSLERCGAACRALHIAARDPDLWRSVCVRTWGLECGTPRAHNFPSWRAMYIARPRLQLHGCYISKTTYLRHGENSFQDQFYRPWYLIDYYRYLSKTTYLRHGENSFWEWFNQPWYFIDKVSDLLDRYLRFFPEGLVLMWTTAEEPASCVQQLKTRAARPALGILPGHYRLIGDKVVIVIKKNSSEKKQTQPSNTRFRARRKDAEQEHTQTFHMELELRSLRGRRNAVLSWARYCVGRRDVWTHFELTPRAFPPFAFSRVRGYTKEALAPL